MRPAYCMGLPHNMLRCNATAVSCCKASQYVMLCTVSAYKTNTGSMKITLPSMATTVLQARTPCAFYSKPRCLIYRARFVCAGLDVGPGLPRRRDHDGHDGPARPPGAARPLGTACQLSFAFASSCVARSACHLGALCPVSLHDPLCPPLYFCCRRRRRRRRCRCRCRCRCSCSLLSASSG
jgi:hypothetical protein